MNIMFDSIARPDRFCSFVDRGSREKGIQVAITKLDWLNVDTVGVSPFLGSRLREMSAGQQSPAIDSRM